MIKIFVCLFVLSIPSEILSSSSDFSSELDLKNGIQALVALRQLLNFIESDAENLNLDGVYGLRIGQGQLNEFKHQNSRFTDKTQMISSLSNQIERIVNKSLTKIRLNSPKYLQRFVFFVDGPFTIEYRQRSIDRNLIEKSERNDEFDEEKSDQCFGELFGTNENVDSKKCSVSESCITMMTAIKTKDYRITHQLLWILAAEKIGCLKKKAHYYEDYFCANIYADAKYNLRNNINQDLFIEQLLLCSMIGFEEFFRYDWFHAVISWQQLDSGCFGSASETKQISRRHLLYDQDMRDGCLSHKSGLAGGLLATYIRFYLQ